MRAARDCAQSLFVEMSGKLYFKAGTYATGDELWVSDGTADGTGMVVNVDDQYSTDYPMSSGFRVRVPLTLTRTCQSCVLRGCVREM